MGHRKEGFTQNRWDGHYGSQLEGMMIAEQKEAGRDRRISRGIASGAAGAAEMKS